MTFVIRSLRMLRADGGELADFTRQYVGDNTPPSRPHTGVWSSAERHWLRTNEKFSRCSEILPDGITGDKARWRVEQASVLLLYIHALDGACWACGSGRRSD